MRLQLAKMLLKLLLFTILVFKALSSSVNLNGLGTYCDGTGWVEYQDEKCYKLITEWATRDKASDLCSKELLQTDSSIPQLVAIKSADEQAFLSEYVFDKSGVEINVWIGAKRVDNSIGSFVWDDGSNVGDFVNWAESGPTGDVKRVCVEMQSSLTRKAPVSKEIVKNEGKWRDVTCQQPNYVVCEKLQRWSIGKLQRTLLEQRKELDVTSSELTETKEILRQTTNRLSSAEKDLSDTKVSLSEATIRLSTAEAKIEDTQKNSVPIGFIYVQLPKEKTPNEIWPRMSWLDVSSTYANVFFRVQGSSTASFGQIQEENAPRITAIHNDLYSLNTSPSVNTVIGGDSMRIQTGPWNYDYKQSIYFTTSGGEVRPRNMAMRVWKRSG